MASSAPATSKKETSLSIKTLEEMIKALSISKTQDEANAAGNNIATLLNGPIEEQSLPAKAVESFKKQLNNKKDAVARERAVDGIRAIAQHSAVSPAMEPYLIAILPLVLAAVGDKMVPVKNSAQTAAVAIARGVNPNAVKAIIPPIANAIKNRPKMA